MLFGSLLASTSSALAAPAFPLSLEVDYCFGGCSDAATFLATLDEDGTFETVNRWGDRFFGRWTFTPGSGELEWVFDMSDFGLELVYRGRPVGGCLQGEIRQVSLATGVVTEGAWRGCRS